MLADDTASTDDQTIVLSGSLQETVFQGESEMALVAIDDETEVAVRFGTSATANATGARQPGTAVKVALDRKDIIIIPGGAAF